MVILRSLKIQFHATSDVKSSDESRQRRRPMDWRVLNLFDGPVESMTMFDGQVQAARLRTLKVVSSVRVVGLAPFRDLNVLASLPSLTMADLADMLIRHALLSPLALMAPHLVNLVLTRCSLLNMNASLPCIMFLNLVTLGDEQLWGYNLGVNAPLG
ncbi:hypothetical protein AMAG_18548 [Allomyces macrogynus ATCC 38327]|uniref:Uncharacterized protein n=1 Tax=Allomyces macrogynus (strain ATCC 38327) TaxID=578462 RepID=A0A0L0SDF0_ALLM3|nr:hypothetical protein AMAG_18548 [Allomyces macrogynus ATCC 38327]|eukprot:KNE60501.1 hypothetical protein AMAG_18548 [Allomyces macrogynus ATCC 38327]